MKNVEKVENAKSNSKLSKKVKIIKKKIAIVSAVGGLGLILSVYGIKRHDVKKIYKLSLLETIEALSKNDDLTNVDNILTQMNITSDNQNKNFMKIVKEFEQAQENKEEICNYYLSQIGITLLKVKIAECYNLDIDSITEFNIEKTCKYVINDDKGEYLYSSTFKYMNNDYSILLEGEKAENIAIYTLRAQENMLKINSQDYCYSTISKAMDSFKDILITEGKTTNEQKSEKENKYFPFLGNIVNVYDGTVKFIEDDSLEQCINVYGEEIINNRTITSQQESLPALKIKKRQ